MNIKKIKRFGEVKENVDLKCLNTFRIGGIASVLIKPDSANDLRDLIDHLNNERIKYFILGNGSNVIFSDDLFDGVIIKLDNLQTIEVYKNINSAYAEAGVMLPVLAKKCLDEGLVGMEWAIGVPGTVGGSVVSNAGCYKSEIFDILKSVTVITPDGTLKKLSKDEISHTYRHTMFKDEKGYIILVAEFELQNGDIDVSNKIINDRRQRRLSEQPLEYPSAGSVFRNPSGAYVDEIIKKHNLKGPYAGHLIEECGLKGKRIGGAEISNKHANFIVNVDNATAMDVKSLIDLAHTAVKERYGIDLVIEQEFVNWK